MLTMKTDSKFCAAMEKSKELKPAMMAIPSMGTGAAAGARPKADGTAKVTVHLRRGATAKN